MAKGSNDPAPKKVTKDDLERGFLGIQQGFRKQVDDRKSTLVTVAGAVGVAIALVIFLLGRRSGKKKTTFVEIRRV
jgi:hypothetical protein